MNSYAHDTSSNNVTIKFKRKNSGFEAYGDPDLENFKPMAETKVLRKH